MKRKLIFAIIELFIFSICFTSSVFVRDYFYEKSLRSNIHKIKVGMTEKEVIRILGKPTQQIMSDVPGLYWCYETNSFYYLLDDNSERLGWILLRVGNEGKVVEVFDRFR
jgi:outer membrane protein assembly factor BamE (lipoprotein component of BamABCDE complex)